MSNSWDDMRRAKEESYFEKKNKEALERMNKKKDEQPRISPVSGAAMEQIVINGVVVDRDPISGGIWLDAGELEQLLSAAQGGVQGGEGQGDNLLTSFVRGLIGKSGK